jgi:hypothetical protein
MVADLGLGMERHGKPKAPGVNSFWADLFGKALITGIVYAGGFFG